MKTVILCGGIGTRMKEETEYKPKPMVLVGGKPILWHIMKIYAHYGFNEFILALGYKGEMIKNGIGKHIRKGDDFKIIFAETGQESLTGERLLRVKEHIREDEFMVTYGDGVSTIDVNNLVDFHHKQGTVATISGTHPRSKYGVIKVDTEKALVSHFNQKPIMTDYINGGFMVFNQKVFDYLDNNPLENVFHKLMPEKQLSVYVHDDFWMAIDTYNELKELNEIWDKRKPWAVWEK